MEERDNIIKKLKSEMKELQDSLEPLRLKAKLGSMEARDRIEELETTVKAKLKPMNAKLDELKSETGEAWSDLAEGCRRSWSETKAAIKSAISRYRD